MTEVRIKWGSRSADFGNHPAPPAPPAPPAAPPTPTTGWKQLHDRLDASAAAGEDRATARATLRGPTRCVPRAFKAIVIGRQIARVRFFLDGKLVATVTKANGPGGSFVRSFDPRKLSPGAHRVIARISFVASARTMSKVRTITFRGCARRATESARFTG